MICFSQTAGETLYATTTLHSSTINLYHSLSPTSPFLPAHSHGCDRNIICGKDVVVAVVVVVVVFFFFWSVLKILVKGSFRFIN